MSYNDSYGPEPRRPGRRATHEPAGSAKVQGTTAAAVLVLVAIVGFGIGAIMGNASDADPADTAADDQEGAAQGTPAEQSDSDDADDEGDDEESSDIAVTFEMDDSASAGEELEYRVFTDPPQPGLVLGIERRLPGRDWEPFGDPQVQAETNEDGEDEGYVITGVAGEAEWRVVGEIDGQRVESNVVTATITEEDDNSGRGNGNGNNDDDDDDD